MRAYNEQASFFKIKEALALYTKRNPPNLGITDEQKTKAASITNKILGLKRLRRACLKKAAIPKSKTS